LRELLKEPTQEEIEARLKAEYGHVQLMSRRTFVQRKALFLGYAVVWGVLLIGALTVVEGWWRPLVALAFLLVPPPAEDLVQAAARGTRSSPRLREATPTT
jgi:hypothetical protein